MAEQLSDEEIERLAWAAVGEYTMPSRETLERVVFHIKRLQAENLTLRKQIAREYGKVVVEQSKREANGSARDKKG